MKKYVLALSLVSVVLMVGLASAKDVDVTVYSTSFEGSFTDDQLPVWRNNQWSSAKYFGWSGNDGYAGWIRDYLTPPDGLQFLLVPRYTPITITYYADNQLTGLWWYKFYLGIPTGGAIKIRLNDDYGPIGSIVNEVEFSSGTIKVSDGGTIVDTGFAYQNDTWMEVKIVSANYTTGTDYWNLQVGGQSVAEGLSPNLNIDYVRAFCLKGMQLGDVTFDMFSMGYVVYVQVPPVANAGPDQLDVQATSPAGASISLNGSDSTLGDGDHLHYDWVSDLGSITEDGVNPDNVETAGAVLSLGVGQTAIATLTVYDVNASNVEDDSNSDTLTASVVDTIAPVVEIIKPQDGEVSPSAAIPVKVRVTDNTATTVSVSMGERTFVLDENGEAEGLLIQPNEEIDITAVAVDLEGNTGSDTNTLIKVHDLGKRK